MNNDTGTARQRRQPLALAAAGITAALILSLFARIDNWRRDFTTNHADLDESSPDPHLRPPTLAGSPVEVAERITAWAEDHPRWTVVAQDVRSDGATLHLTRTTRLFRFVDDIHVQLTVTGDRTRVDAESRSRVGKGDLGQNPRNLKELTRGLSSSIAD